VFSEEPKKRADWIDFGRDFYAVVSYENVPGDQRIWIGWMNNWDYANQIPTSPWRSAQALPRSVTLATVDDEIKLVQQPVRGIQRLKKGPVFTYNNSPIPAGTTALDAVGASGSALVIEAELEPGSASSFGLNLAVGNGEKTVVGYDVLRGELFVDRTQSGQTDFSSRFPSVEWAPLALQDGRLKLTIFLDWSSVEVFGGRGETVITDQIFPGPDSTGVELFADGGSAFAHKLKIMQMKSIW
jgi:fructan beta-fructosidase